MKGLLRPPVPAKCVLPNLNSFVAEQCLFIYRHDRYVGPTFQYIPAGKGTEKRLLGAPVPVERITYHAHSAPLHKIKTDNMLPSQLLTPFQVFRLASLQYCAYMLASSNMKA